MAKTIKKRRRWKPADIERAAIAYCIEGNISAASKACNIPASTIRDFRENSEVWDIATVQYRDQNNDQFIARANQIIDLATDVTIEKLPDASARDAATIGAIFYDKQRLALSLPTRITTGSTDQQIAALVDSFSALADTYNARNVNVIKDIKPGDEED
jgi:hypothetical protein